MSKRITITKGHTRLNINPVALSEHIRLGWMVAEVQDEPVAILKPIDVAAHTHTGIQAEVTSAPIEVPVAAEQPAETAETAKVAPQKRQRKGKSAEQTTEDSAQQEPGQDQGDI